MAESHFILVEYEDGDSFATTSPFEIAAAIRHLVGEVEAAKPTTAGKLLIKTKNQDRADILLKQDLFLEKKADFSYHKTSSSRRKLTSATQTSSTQSTRTRAP